MKSIIMIEYIDMSTLVFAFRDFVQHVVLCKCQRLNMKEESTQKVMSYIFDSHSTSVLNIWKFFSGHGLRFFPDLVECRLKNMF